MLRLLVAAVTGALLLAPFGASAQTPAPPPGYGPSIGLESAKKILAAAEAKAKKNGWQMAVAIVDSGGKLVAFTRMDNTMIAATDIVWAPSECLVPQPTRMPKSPLLASLLSQSSRVRAFRRGCLSDAASPL